MLGPVHCRLQVTKFRQQPETVNENTVRGQIKNQKKRTEKIKRAFAQNMFINHATHILAKTIL
jgi:hypothetical protein